MVEIRITCIRLAHTAVCHEQITHVGNSSGVWLREQVVLWIDHGLHVFYVQDAHGNRAAVRVVRERDKVPYLRTYANRQWSDTLLTLPGCR